MSFLPAICSLVQDECVDRMVPDGVGPVAVILCVSSVKVAEVAGLCRKLLSNCSNDVRVVESFGERNINRIVVSVRIPALTIRNLIISLQPLLFNGCGILVCTVPNLHRLLNLEIELNRKLLDKNRIRHLVIDDIDQMVRYRSELDHVKKLICPRASNSPTEVQVFCFILHEIGTDTLTCIFRS